LNRVQRLTAGENVKRGELRARFTNSVAPSPNTVLRPIGRFQSHDDLTIFKGRSVYKYAARAQFASGRRISCFTFCRLASMKFSLAAGFSIS
jgi:hypothetical protein